MAEAISGLQPRQDKHAVISCWIGGPMELAIYVAAICRTSLSETTGRLGDVAYPRACSDQSSRTPGVAGRLGGLVPFLVAAVRRPRSNKSRAVHPLAPVMELAGAER